MKKIFKSKKAEGYVDSGVKILIAVVIGALLLAGLYTLFNDTIMPSVETKIESLFNYSAEGGSGGSGGQISNTFSFTISGRSYEAEEGMTWDDWIDSDYNTPGYFNDSGAVGCGGYYIVYTEGMDDAVSAGSAINKGHDYGSYSPWW